MKPYILALLGALAILMAWFGLAGMFTPSATWSSFDWMPRQHCYQAEPWVFWVMLPSDIGILLSYVLMPVGITYHLLTRTRKILPTWGLVLYALFILFCGVGHGLDGLVQFWGWLYGPLAVCRALTLLVSAPSAVATVYGVLQVGKLVEQNEVLQVRAEGAENRLAAFLRAEQDAEDAKILALMKTSE